MTATVTPIRPELPGEAGERLTGPQLCVLAGISYRQLDFWTRTGKLRPHGPDKSGAGRYSESEARIAGLMKRLLDIGFSLRDAATYARQLVETGQPVALAGGLVRIDPAEVAR